ncbi:uncharacterized protein B0I36DRAFT_362855 [Microdochium trichocladiopsis]|uniref:Uncharacterized protein n=1 Tax=Microdochium trichocladiopsis TaxID=1682393 RepID=A0A9P9BQN9_9PEZI|nr:uncharacterized protein B0I36DRAFT_362855 [Microdochium trichocladiopsis]KAH7031112.1 hypothetical protein B0I36DRAFT_362855 [Microdochium trichocladiopsis]
MPSTDIKTFLDSKPVSFRIQTAGRTWACELHSDRHSLERKRAALAAAGASTPDLEGLPSLPRTDSGLSNSSSKASSISHGH